MQIAVRRPTNADEWTVYRIRLTIKNSTVVWRTSAALLVTRQSTPTEPVHHRQLIHEFVTRITYAVWPQPDGTELGSRDRASDRLPTSESLVNNISARVTVVDERQSSVRATRRLRRFIDAPLSARTIAPRSKSPDPPSFGPLSPQFCWLARWPQQHWGIPLWSCTLPWKLHPITTDLT